jgi:UDP-2,3-diacylglucosamine pyrophosphatase LpxH
MAGRTLVISDLHLGNGGDYDVFAGGEALPALLAEFAAPENHVICNGDTVDFLMNEDPLDLNEARALAELEKSLAVPSTAGVLHALGKVLGAGGEVTLRLGNHDIELALKSVQDRIRTALAEPPAVAARLRFERGDEPAILNAGGARILVTHGEHWDTWNRVDYSHLPGQGAGTGFKAFTYAAGSRLVRTLLNPLIRQYGMRFAELLKPDFQGGVLSALGINPQAVKVVFQGSTLKMMWELFRQSTSPNTFAEDPEAQDLGLAKAVDSANLTHDERNALTTTLDPNRSGQRSPLPLSDADGSLLGSAYRKLARAGLRLYASAQHAIAGDSGEFFFSFTPSAEEWNEAQRLAKKYSVEAVIFGHSHAARWQAQDGLVYVNTGTWIWLMHLPSPSASDEEWDKFLELLQRNPRLDPAKGPSAPVLSRFTAAVIDAYDNQGGALVSLIEWTKEDGIKYRGQNHVPPAKPSAAP